MEEEYLKENESLFDENLKIGSGGAIAAGIITPNETRFLYKQIGMIRKKADTHDNLQLKILYELYGKENVDKDATPHRVVRVTQIRGFNRSESRMYKESIYQIPRILTPYEFEMLKNQIGDLKTHGVDIGGIIYDIDPRWDKDKIYQNKNKTLFFGKRFGENEGIESMLEYLEKNLEKDGYTIIEMKEYLFREG